MIQRIAELEDEPAPVKTATPRSSIREEAGTPSRPIVTKNTASHSGAFEHFLAAMNKGTESKPFQEIKKTLEQKRPKPFQFQATKAVKYEPPKQSQYKPTVLAHSQSAYRAPTSLTTPYLDNLTLRERIRPLQQDLDRKKMLRRKMMTPAALAAWRRASVAKKARKMKEAQKKREAKKKQAGE